MKNYINGKESVTRKILKQLIKDGENLSKVDVSQITNMDSMFYYSNFNGDISNWNVSNVTNMERMFSRSKFNGDISNWDVSNVINMRYMFSRSKFNGDISNWDIDLNKLKLSEECLKKNKRLKIIRNL